MNNKDDCFLGIMKKCSICNNMVLCTLDSNPETHNNECKQKFIILNNR